MDRRARRSVAHSVAQKIDQNLLDHIHPQPARVKEAEDAVKPSGGRVLLRYSGTEPKARLLIEGPDQRVLENWSAQIIGAIKAQVGA